MTIRRLIRPYPTCRANGGSEDNFRIVDNTGVERHLAFVSAEAAGLYEAATQFGRTRSQMFSF
jgi:hypothetical protein